MLCSPVVLQAKFKSPMEVPIRFVTRAQATMEKLPTISVNLAFVDNSLPADFLVPIVQFPLLISSRPQPKDASNALVVTKPI